jgi:2-keto-4-pentenoate hydratase
VQAAELDALAREVRAAQDAAATLAPLTARHPAFDIAAGYAVAARIHRQRVAEGAVPRGRKIGFTNAAIWPEYDVHQPIWGWVYEHTLQAAAGRPVRIPLSHLSEPKIEPEIAFGLKAAPPARADVAALLPCIDWVAPAFEIVQSHFPGWTFQAADTIADGGLHGALVLGTQVPLSALGADPVAALASLEMVLSRDGREVEVGAGRNALGNPLTALAHLCALLAEQGPDVALQAGEVITTGTVTAAYAVRPGETWQATPRHPAWQPLQVEFA